MSVNRDRFLPKTINWFRLPEYVKQIFEAEPDNTAELLLAFDSEGAFVTVDKSTISGGGGGTDDQTAAEVPFDPTIFGSLTATDVQGAIDEITDTFPTSMPLAGVGITDNAGTFDLGDPAISQDITWDLIPITVGRDLRKISITNSTDGNSIDFTQESLDINTERISATLSGSATFNTASQFAVNQGGTQVGDASTTDGVYINSNGLLLRARNLLQIRPANDVIDGSQIGQVLTKVDATGTTEWATVTDTNFTELIGRDTGALLTDPTPGDIAFNGTLSATGITVNSVAANLVDATIDNGANWIWVSQNNFLPGGDPNLANGSIDITADQNGEVEIFYSQTPNVGLINPQIITLVAGVTQTVNLGAYDGTGATAMRVGLRRSGTPGALPTGTNISTSNLVLNDSQTAPIPAMLRYIKERHTFDSLGNEIGVTYHSLDNTVYVLVGDFEFLDESQTSLQSVVAGTNISIDNTDPQNPVINSTGGGGISSVVAGTNTSIDNTDPANPIVNTVDVVNTTGTQSSINGFKTFTSIVTAATLRASSGLIGMVEGTADNVQLNGYASIASDTNGDFMYNKDNSSATGWKFTTNNTSKRAYTMQDADGTVAFLSDIPAGGSTGLELISEGAGSGWRLIGRDPLNYGDIGQDAVDLSVGQTPSTTFGATGSFSFATGIDNTASNIGSFVTGSGNISSGSRSFATGTDNTASGSTSFASGDGNVSSGTRSFTAGQDHVVSGVNGFAINSNNVVSSTNGFAAGLLSYSRAVGEFSIGVRGTDYTPNGTNDRAFNVGIGTSNVNLLDGFTVLKTGEVRADNLTNAIIDAAADEVLVTKGWVQVNAGGSTKYNQSFVIADWTSQQITILATTHGVGTKPLTQVYDASGNIVNVDINRNVSGDVILTVIPGEEFDGEVTIL